MFSITKKYKRLLLVVAFAAMLPTTMLADNAGDGRHWFFVETANGVTNRFIIHDKATFSVEKDSLVLRSGEIEASYLRTRVKKFYVLSESEMSDDIADVMAEGISFERKDKETVIVTGIPEGEAITVFSSNGIEQLQLKSKGTRTEISLASLSSGIYIISSNKFGSIKILK